MDNYKLNILNMPNIERFLCELDEHSEIYIQTKFDKFLIETKPSDILNYLEGFVIGSNSIFTADDYVNRINGIENHFIILFRKRDNWEMEKYFGKAMFQKIILP